MRSSRSTRSSSSAAGAVDLDEQPAVARRGAHRDAGAGPRLSDLRDEEVRGGLDRRAEALLGQRLDHDRHAARPRRAPRAPPRAPRRRAPRGRSRARARAARRARRAARPRRRRRVRGRVGVDLGAQQPQREREHDEPLLRAVVEVALEPPALGVARLDVRAREARSCSSCARASRLQPLVVEREPGGRADVLEQPGIVEQLGAVDEHGDRPRRRARAASPRGPSPRGSSTARPCGVDVARRRRADRRARAPDRRARRPARRAGGRAAGASPSSMTSRATVVRARRPRTQAEQTPSTSDTQRRRLPEPEPPVDAVVGEEAALEAVRVAGGDQRRDTRRPPASTGAVSSRAAEDERAIRATREHRRADGAQTRPSDDAGALDRLHEPGDARDGQEVPRALRAALRGRVEHERRQQAEHEDRARVGEQEPRALEPAADAARRDRRARRARRAPGTPRRRTRPDGERRSASRRPGCRARRRTTRSPRRPGSVRSGSPAAAPTPTTPHATSAQPAPASTRLCGRRPAARATRRARCGRSPARPRRARDPRRGRAGGAAAPAHLPTPRARRIRAYPCGRRESAGWPPMCAARPRVASGHTEPGGPRCVPTQPAAALSTVLAALALAGCGDSGADKAGGERQSKPTVLTLANGNGDPGDPAALRRRRRSSSAAGRCGSSSRTTGARRDQTMRPE